MNRAGETRGDPARQNARALFTFLKELTELRMKAVRSVDQYEHVLWLSDVPQEKGCFCVAWNLGREEEERGDTWIEIHKPKLVPPPSPEALLEPWLIAEQISDSSRDMPELREEISVRVENADESGEPFERQRLEDHPEVREAWERYVEDKWWPWAENDRPLQKVQRVYTDLFTIYQRQQRLGEQYEVVLGLGLLVWQTRDRQEIARHLITAQTSLEFEAARGVMRVGPAGEGARPALEQDMLDPKHRPDPMILQGLEEQVSDIGDDIWDKTKLDAALKAWVHAASPKGIYEDILARPESAGPEPCAHLAPAIVLRRRTERSFVRAFEEIVRQFDEGAAVPPGITQFVRPVVKLAPERETEEHPDDSVPLGQPSEIYFPLEVNDAQREIVQRLQTQQGVLVQGPPGTGKSHTIVNLVCHLLAAEKRILVTSHAARALRVLKRFLSERTPEVAPLAVVLLGDDRESLEAMEISVQGIMDRHNRWDPRANHRVAEKNEKTLREARKKEAEILNQLRAIRESETYEHAPRFENYQGTLQQIGEQLRKEQPQHGWIPDRPAEDAGSPLTDEEAQSLLGLLRDNAIDDADETWDWESIDPGTVVAPDQFRDLVNSERAARRRYDSTDAGRDHSGYKGLLDATQEQRKQLSDSLRDVLTDVDEITRHVHAWTGTMVYAILGDYDRPWRELFEATQEQLKAIGNRARWADETPVSGIEARNLAEVKADAEDVLEHFEAGAGWGIPGLRRRVAKRALYLREHVRVGGRSCETPQRVRDLVSWLDVALRLEQLKRLWERYASPSSQTFAATVKEYEDFCEPLERGLDVHNGVADLRTRIQSLPNVPEPTWHDLATIRSFKKAIEAAEAETDLREIRARFEDAAKTLETHIRRGKVDPEGRTLVQALRDRDVEGYARACATIRDHLETHQRLLQRRELMERLRRVAPKLAKVFGATPDDAKWEERLAEFRRAWNWAGARAWVDRLSDPEEDERLRLALDRERERIREALQNIAAAKAWGHCFARMTEHERQHLVAWSKATKRIGKGTGKYAAVHRRAARQHMEECRSAIPAWIMPLYRVAETIRPGKDVFDVIIIDEASQSGAEALLLPYLAKQVVVVGDDKQISPESVGINREDVGQLRRRHIADLPHSDRYGVDDSFFDLADIIYPGRIRLREHFRCLPEIIQFSNDLCYQSPPLIPLKQYGTFKLAPVVGTHYIREGYVRGTGSKVDNEPEAKAIADRLEQCCKNAAYDGKSFGVISLLGPYQARLIERLLLDCLGPEEMERRQIVCGDAYAFQGDERDVMFLSMVSAPTEGRRIGVLTKDSDQRRFNVAASRAREQMILFHSATLNDLSPMCLRYRLLKYCLNPKVTQPLVGGIHVDELRQIATKADRDRTLPPSPFESWFQVDVFLRIAERDYRVIPEYEVGGYRIDLVVEGMERRLAVECDGDQWHGPDRYNQDMSRQRMLERCGWRFWRVRGSAFAVDPDGAMESLWETLNGYAIHPEAFSTAAADKAPEDVVNKAGEEKLEAQKEVGRTESELGALSELPEKKIIDFPKRAIRPTADPSASSSLRSKGQPETAPASERRTMEEPQTQPYREWRAHPLPDPRTESRSVVLQGLTEIIEAEGPMLVLRAFQFYAKAAGSKRVGRSIRSHLNSALAQGLRQKVILAEREHEEQGQLRLIARTPDAPRTVVRALGSRSFSEIPPSEVGEVMQRIRASGRVAGRDDLFRAVLEHYRLVRITAQVAAELHRIYEKEFGTAQPE